MNENKNFNQSKNGMVDRIQQERQMIHNVIDCALADPKTIKDIKDGEITVIGAVMEALMSILTSKCGITVMECGRLMGRLEYLASQITLTEAREKAKAHSRNIVMTKCENR